MSTALRILGRSRRIPLLLGMVVLLTAAVFVSQPRTAEAATLRPFLCFYYSDATKTVRVGTVTFNCSGSIASSTGIATPYSTCYNDYCCGTQWC